MPKVFAASLKTGKVKNSGVLIIQDDGVMKWDPKNGQGGFLTPLKNVEKLFASQPTKPNHLLKLTCQINAKTDDYMFAFEDRPLLEKAKTELQTAIKEQREGSAVKSDAESKRPVTNKLDNKSLLENFQLQHQILKENKELAEAFRGAVIENGLSPESFWSTRLHILRPHAMLMGQKRGAYNVLGDIKPTTSSDNQIKISVTREQIHDIFQQYPIVQQAYTENVPNLNENLFWQRFFMSKLFRRLRGEKISNMDAPDPLLDQYLTPEGNVKRALSEEESASFEKDAKKQRRESPIPSYLNIEGNEENQETTSVNVPDITMQPGKSSKDIVSLIRSMNGLSQKMLHIHNGIEYQDKNENNLQNQLSLQDLEGPSQGSRYIDLDLVNDNTNSGQTDLQKSKNGVIHVAPEKLDAVRSSVSSQFDLQSVYASEHVKSATEDIISLQKQNYHEESGTRSYPWIDSEQDSNLMSRIMLCHAASMEFLKQFWLRFQSGDAAQTATLSSVVKSLRKSNERVEAVVGSVADEVKRQQVAHVFSNMMDSINTALAKYDRAVEAANGNSA